MFDSRFGKNVYEYNERELLLAHLDEVKKSNALINALGHNEKQAIARLTERLEHNSLQRSKEASRLEDLLVDNMSDLQAVLGSGFSRLEQTFEWGFSALFLKLDLQHRTLGQIAEAVVNPLTNQGREQRQKGEKSILNGWYDEAVIWLSRAVETNSLDYLAHFELAHLRLFHYSEYEEAKKHFELAAKYSNYRGASDVERFYSSLSYAHLSLVNRVRGGSNAYQAALECAKLGYEVCNSCVPTVIEYLYMLCVTGKDELVSSLLTEVLKKDENLLLILRGNSALRRCPNIQTAFETWGEYHRICLKRIDSFQSACGLAGYIVESSSLGASEKSIFSTPRQLVLRYCTEVEKALKKLIGDLEREHRTAIDAHSGEIYLHRGALEQSIRDKDESKKTVITTATALTGIILVIAFIWGLGYQLLIAIGASSFVLTLLHRCYGGSRRESRHAQIEAKMEKLEDEFRTKEMLLKRRLEIASNAISELNEVRREVELFEIPTMSQTP